MDTAERRALSGRIMRGIADRIDAVIWFSDLRRNQTLQTFHEAPRPLARLSAGRRKLA